MGISGLLQFLKDASEPVNVKKYRGQSVAVDTYCWLHKGAFSCAEKLAKGETTDQYVWYCMKLVDMLLIFGVKPILVFDGRNLPSKREVEKTRRERRELNLQKGKQLLRDGKLSEARDCFNRCVNITPAMAHNLIKVARSRGVDCLVAPYEADAQLAFLSKSGLAQAVITEDSDLLAFGCKNVILKMDKQGNGLEISQSHFGRVKCLGNVFTEEKFRHMCIISGCDYLPSLHGIGLGKACKLLRLSRDPDILKVIKKMGQYLKMDLLVPDSYLEGFTRANNTFLYQLVFDPRSRRVVPLNPYPEDLDQGQDLSYAGLNLGDQKGLQMALGNLDLNTLEKIDDFNPDTAPQTQSKARSRSWNDAPSSLPIGSIWTREASTAPPTGCSREASTAPPKGCLSPPPADARTSTRGQHKPLSVAPLKLQLKRPREDCPLSEQDMFLQYSSKDQKRQRTDPSPSSPKLPPRSRNRFATLLQQRNQSGEGSRATRSRFFHSSPPPSPPLSSPHSDPDDCEAPEAPSVDTPTSSPTAPPAEPPAEPPAGPTAGPTAGPPAVSPSATRGQQLFHWSSSPPSLPPQSGLSALKRFRFRKTTETHSSPTHCLSPSPDSQDSAYFSQPQAPTETPPDAPLEEAGLCTAHDLDRNTEADLSSADRKLGTPTYKAAGLSRPHSSQPVKPRSLGPARVSGLRKSGSRPGPNNENSPSVQATISGLWKHYSFSKVGPKMVRKEPLSPVKDNTILL